MKQLSLFFLFVLFTSLASGQVPGGPTTTRPGPGTVSGKVIDSLSKLPVEYATVSIFPPDSKTPLSGVITDSKGNFKITSLATGNYRLSINFVGYPTKAISPVLITEGKPNLSLGTILFSSGRTTLNEVKVVGQASLVETKIDRIVYNVEKDITAAGGTATDVLGKVPMVSVDMNGNVSVRGDQNVRVMINGKSTGASAANISDVLRAIPADQIKNIEVITSPSAKYDAEGSAGIINIVTRQKNVSGFSGSINGGVGTRQNNGNINLNYNAGRFHATANVGSFLSWPQTTTSDFEQRITNDSINTTSSTKGTGRTKRHAVNGSLNLGFDFNAANSISTTLRLMRFQNDNFSSSNSISATPYSYTSDGHNSFGNFDWSADYTHKFNETGHELDYSMQWSHGSGVNDYTNLYSGVFTSLQNNIDSKNNEYTFQVDYALPVSKVLKLEAGAKSILRRINSTSDYYLQDQNTSFVFDPIASNMYKYNQNVFAGYTQLTFTLPKQWSVLAGLRDEVTSIDGDPENASQALSPFTQHYNTLVPSLTLQKQLTNRNTIKLVYSKRISRPSLQYLNPFVNSSAPQSQSAGNPELDPEISHTYELDFNAFLGSSILNSSLYYRHTTGLIEGIAAPIAVTVNGVAQGGTLTTFQNVGNNNSIGGNIFTNVTIFKIFQINGNVSAFTYKPDPAGIFINNQSQNGTYVMYNGFLRGTLTLPKDYLAEVFGFGSSSRRTIQGVNPAFSMYGIGIRKQFMQKKLSLGINATQPFANEKHFNSSVNSPGLAQTSSTSIPFRSFGITFSYNFGKMTFSEPRKRKGINNDDLKQGEQQQGGGPN